MFSEKTNEDGSSFIISPWYIYQWYGDSRLIAEYYPDMQRYIEYLSSQAKDHIVAYGLGDWFDIGPNVPGVSQLRLSNCQENSSGSKEALKDPAFRYRGQT